MAQAQPSEKLHTACDECRTRKLKCSGEKPLCGRCQREHIECVYSPQKTMGRPRKRRREEAGAEAEGVSATLQNNGNDNFPLDMPAAHAQCFNSSLGLASPPEHADVPSGNEVYAQAQIDPSLAGLYGPQPPLSAFDFNLTPAIDPSLWDSTTPNPTPPSAPSPNGPCTCLSLTYLTLTDLQTVSTFSFPQVIIPLRRAMSSVSSLLHCPTCPQDPFSAIQNVASLASLFKAIISRFAEVLGEVDREAASLRATGAKKPFRIGDLNPALQHLHTGTLDCPMGFNVELEPDVWVKLVKQALRTEMFGGGSNATPLVGLLSEVEERQQNWHRNRGVIGEEGMKVWGQGEDGRCERDKGVCEGLGGEHIRRAIGGLKWE